MKVLGIDVCTGSCAVALVDGAHVLASAQEPMTRGHVERLAPMVQEVLDAAGINPPDLSGIAVTTGPGSFTGARLGVSFARGLALATDAPAVGISVFEAMAAMAGTGAILIALDGKRDALFMQGFSDGTASFDPTACPPQDAGRLAPEGNFNLIGSGADLFLANAPDAVKARAQVKHAASIPPEIIARLGAAKLAQGETAPSAPLYMRDADAKPQPVVSLG